MVSDWKRYEKRKARTHRGKHVGGSGKPDYVRGDKKGEVKHRKTPLTKPEVMKLAKKGVTEIESLSGYTTPAKKYVCKHRPNLKLYKKGRRVKCRG